MHSANRASGDPVACSLSVCLLRGCAVQKRLSGSNWCSEWRHSGTQDALNEGPDFQSPTIRGVSMRLLPNYFGLLFVTVTNIEPIFKWLQRRFLSLARRLSRCQKYGYIYGKILLFLGNFIPDSRNLHNTPRTPTETSTLSPTETYVPRLWGAVVSVVSRDSRSHGSTLDQRAPGRMCGLDAYTHLASEAWLFDPTASSCNICDVTVLDRLLAHLCGA